MLENARVLMDTTPADARTARARRSTALGRTIELRRLRLRESGGRYFADVVVAVTPGQAIVEGARRSRTRSRRRSAALPDTDVVVHLEPRARA